MNDKIADMMIRIKNAGKAKLPSTVVPYSQLKLDIAQVLMKEGFIASIAKKGKKAKKYLEIGLAYNAGEPKVHDAQRVSKVSRRVYYGYRDIRKVRSGYGLLVLSTPKGIMSGETARKEHVGGEPLFKVW